MEYWIIGLAKRCMNGLLEKVSLRKFQTSAKINSPKTQLCGSTELSQRFIPINPTIYLSINPSFSIQHSGFNSVNIAEK